MPFQNVYQMWKVSKTKFDLVQIGNLYLEKKIDFWEFVPSHMRHKPGSRVYVCGNVPALGKWFPSQVILKKKNCMEVQHAVHGPRRNQNHNPVISCVAIRILAVEDVDNFLGLVAVTMAKRVGLPG